MSYLTIMLFQDSEKPLEYLNNNLKTLKEWNSAGLKETQIILITQKQTTTEADNALKLAGLAGRVIKSDNTYVAGRPVWDVLRDLRKAWPYVDGKYVTVNHSEFIWCPNRLERTITWLKNNRYYVALGNLRRPASDKVPRPRWRPGNCDKNISDQLIRYINAGHWKLAADIAERLPTLMWPLWKAHIYKFGQVHWQEDIFFIDKGWLDIWRGIDHGGELPYQDIWDLLGAGIKRMEAIRLEPKIVRMPEVINRIIHAWHPKPYKSWSPEIRDWFLKDPKRWKNTQFLNSALWQRLLRLRDEADTNDQNAKYDLRRGPGGTVTRYEEAARAYFLNGGRLKLQQFYGQYGRDSRLHANY